MSCVTIAADTTAAEEASLALHYPWQCYSDNLRTFEEFPSLEAMAKSKGVSAQVVMDAVASNQGNLDGFHFVKR